MKYPAPNVDGQCKTSAGANGDRNKMEQHRLRILFQPLRPIRQKEPLVFSLFD